MLKHIRAVIFDMDGLMLDSERVVQQAWTIAGNRLGYQNLGDNIYETIGFNVVRREQFFRQRYGSAFPFEEFQEYNREAFREITAERPLQAKPGLHELLKVLKEKRIKIAVATSSREGYAKKCLKDIDALSFMEAVVYGGMVDNGKPAPDIYRMACSLLNEKPEHCLALEDSPNGVASAHAAGVPVIMIPDLVEPDEAVRQMIHARKDSLLEIIPFFIPDKNNTV